MFAVQQRYHPEIFTAEAGSIEKSLGPFLTQEMGIRGIYINLEPMVPTKDKQSRARSIQARMRQGSVYCDQEAEWYPALETQMVRFPRDVHDDQVDALAWIGLTLDKIVPGLSSAELEDEEWEEEFGATLWGAGRNTNTGY